MFGILNVAKFLQEFTRRTLSGALQFTRSVSEDSKCFSKIIEVPKYSSVNERHPSKFTLSMVAHLAKFRVFS